MTENTVAHKPDGGPVHPTAVYEDPMGIKVVPGMTLRDYFAGQALANIVGITSDESIEWNAAYCYRQADAMLSERAK